MTDDKLILYRHTFLDDRTLGQLYHAKTLLCDTLEPVRDLDYSNKDKNTCVPPDTYQVIYNLWQKHGQVTPMLIGILNYAGVRIHWGNNPNHTTACILVGVKDVQNNLYKSRITFNQVFTYMYNRNIKKVIITHEKPSFLSPVIQV